MVLYYGPSTVLSTLHAVSYLNSYEASNYYYSHFTDDKIEGQHIYIICTRLQTQELAALRCEPRQSASKVCF